MRKLNILKGILDLFWFFSIIGVLSIIVILPLYFLDSDFDVPIKIKGQEIVSKTVFSKITVSANFISGILFVYSIYLLRKVVILFQKREIFNDEVVRLLNVIGQLIIASSLISNLSLLIYNAIEKNQRGSSLDLGSYDSFLISVSLGLFFMVISVIFKIAKNMKEESELTI